MRIDVMGVGFDNLTKSEFTAKAEDMLRNKERGYVVTPNAEIVYESIHDDAFRALLNDASMVLPDGAGVVLGAKILGTPIKEKVAGIEFGEEVCKLLAKNNGRLYLLGSKPGIANAAGEKLAQKYPGLVICGTADGYFKDEKAVIEKINEAKPDVLFVCLGAPKQEKFIKEHFDELDVTLMLGLGGSLDGYAGVAQRAPKWMIDLSLEWLYRLMKEPKRLGRMMRLPKFVAICTGEKLRRKRNG
ncbi:MAG: WecB/TagA/CpsF family glycosyltransferase [Oscillospiraceae bacterium]|nr:WecB/TagA/CpsF family glycosyltransferase [Oscillospiraceae bacterium]